MKSAQELADEYQASTGWGELAEGRAIHLAFLAGYAAAEPRVLALQERAKELETRIWENIQEFGNGKD